MFINSKYMSPYFLNFTYCIKSTNLHSIPRNWQMYLFCPLTNTFPIDDARPLIMPHEYVEPIEITLLEHIHDTNFNHQL